MITFFIENLQIAQNMCNNKFGNIDLVKTKVLWTLVEK